MTGLYSLWTEARGFRLTYPLAMLYSAAAAFGTKCYPDTELVTDKKGLEIADRLGWRFTSYSLGLHNFCPDNAKHIWMLGKIKAQAIQTRPHVHTDLDLLLYGSLPDRLRTARVFAQSKDNVESYVSGSVAEVIELAGLSRSAVPYNTALIGWNDLDLRTEYCSRAFDAALKIADKVSHGGIASIVCEQVMLGEVMRQRRVRIEEAIPMPVHAQAGDYDVRFTHFWGKDKANSWLPKLQERFQAEFPDEYLKFRAGFAVLDKAPA